jgi:hypothetical protein
MEIDFLKVGAGLKDAGNNFGPYYYLSQLKVLENENKISFCHFETKDVVRHHLVQRIVSAYDKFT